MTTLGIATPKGHVYQVGVEGPERQITVYAANRDQASRIATKAGYVVRDVNMEG
ncbi:hypothetical protein PJWF_00076 [Achromobacter phage JWF]|uniref:hypothetical protein n=1 Tax=Achromobacter phage JWF TaxID=1589748 RepID=UPI000588E3FF|nr:hypothetical protein AXJ13_gp112 [Achromobacter phage JWF]AJD82969.1 hypothetical protein PJWF_00076 [Achromobacter phage JWF]